MKKICQFCLDEFLALSGAELRDYTEPFVNENREALPESLYEPLQSKLAVLDEEHIVYAIEISMLLRPKEFAGCAVQFLSHSDSAVCCTAFRTIERLPAAYITNELLEQIRATPVTNLFTTHVRTGERVEIGTNEMFIRDLLAKDS